MSLTEDVRQWVLSNLPYSPSDPNDADIVQALQSKDAHDLLIIYKNWIDRRVLPTPRQIKKSSFFKSSKYLQSFAEALAKIETDVVAGHDLTKYLGKGVRVALKLPTQRRGASDLDMLLNDWGVHHLHLSTEVEANGFVKRTGPVLFARFTNNAAYFLDIGNHGEWAKESIADSLANEFPESGGVHVLNGVAGLSYEATDEEHKKLRAAGINTVRMIGGKAVMGSGYNNHGHPLRALRMADHILEGIERFERMWNESEQEVRHQLQAQGVELPENPSFHFDMVSGTPAIVERTTQTLVGALM